MGVGANSAGMLNTLPIYPQRKFAFHLQLCERLAIVERKVRYHKIYSRRSSQYLGAPALVA